MAKGRELKHINRNTEIGKKKKKKHQMLKLTRTRTYKFFLNACVCVFNLHYTHDSFLDVQISKGRQFQLFHNVSFHLSPTFHCFFLVECFIPRIYIVCVTACGYHYAHVFDCEM